MSSLVNECGCIGPEEKDGQRKYETVTKQSEKMVFHQFKEHPDSCGPRENSAGDLLVPP